MAPFGEDRWLSFLRAQNERQTLAREALRVEVASSAVPLPHELLQRVVLQSDAPSILRGHPGFDLWERCQSYFTSLDVFNLCLDDLLGAIHGFEGRAVADKPDLFERQRESELRMIQQRIQKELFASANAAASLVDHCRRIDPATIIAGYDARRRTEFGSDGLHEFVINLRVLLHHLRIVDAGWNLTNSVRDGQSATFKLSKENLLRAIDDFSGLASRASTWAFVNSHDKDLDLVDVFRAYRDRASRFHGWLRQELSSPELVALRDYERCLSERAKALSRVWWAAMLGNFLNWPAPPNPHHHLHRYLTRYELAQVRRLPRNSQEQVDLVIRLVDDKHAATDDLRRSVKILFDRSPRYRWQDGPQWLYRRSRAWIRARQRRR
ncbi:hypothetical protein [Devosia sp. Root635]|uniref:hypothetical protein n=1 Tax=Devosia sp. Root635 TaxID=1736575 RepID=UPI0012E37517|nr:hypothetical protein [Devosia sp. Root635]